MVWKNPSGVSERDFRVMILGDWGRTVTLYSYTGTNENAEDPITGDEGYSASEYDSGTDITAIFSISTPAYFQDWKLLKEGLIEESDAYLMVKNSQAIKRNDYIQFTEGSTYKYKVHRVYDLMGIAKFCTLYLLEKS